MSEFVVKDAVLREGSFGAWFDFGLPWEYDIIVLCWNDGYGLKPMSVRLPHQVYLKDLEAWAAEHPGCKSFVAIPAKSSEYLNFYETPEWASRPSTIPKRATAPTAWSPLPSPSDGGQRP